MLYNFYYNLLRFLVFLMFFKYITFRTGLAVFTSLVIVLIIGGPFIKIVSKKEF